MKCAFCGFEFDPAQRQACSACPLSSNCGKLCCPHCGYEAVRPAPAVEFVRRLLRRGPARRPEGPHRAGIALTRLPIGRPAYVLALGAEGGRQVARLMAMGILPGVTIRLLRRFPAYVFAVGNSQFAIDEQLASQVLVQPEEAEES